jgi:hypothetical protein
MIKKIISIFISFSFCGLTLVLAQEENLVELAKKERERRESLKGKKVKVITNKDLENLTKTPALTLPPQPQPAEPQGLTEATSAGTAPSVVHRVTVENLPEQMQPETGTRLSSPPSGSDASTASLEEAWKKAQEYVELLTLKMNQLWAEFYSQTGMKSRDSIQQQISETYDKLLKAQEEEARLRKEYEDQINRKKSESASPIWIR